MASDLSQQVLSQQGQLPGEQDEIDDGPKAPNSGFNGGGSGGCPLRSDNCRNVVTCSLDSLPFPFSALAQMIAGIAGVMLLIWVVLPCLFVCSIHAAVSYYLCCGFKAKSKASVKYTANNTYHPKGPAFLRIYFGRWRLSLLEAATEGRSWFWQAQHVIVQFYSFLEFYVNRDSMIDYLGSLTETFGDIVPINEGIMVTNPDSVTELLAGQNTLKPRMIDGLEPTPMTADYAQSNVLFEQTGSTAHSDGRQIFANMMRGFQKRYIVKNDDGSTDVTASLQKVIDGCSQLVPYEAYSEQVKPNEVLRYTVRTAMFLLNNQRLTEDQESLIMNLVNFHSFGSSMPPMVSFLLGGRLFERMALKAQNTLRDIYLTPEYSAMLTQITGSATAQVGTQDTLNTVALLLRLNLGKMAGIACTALSELRQGNVEQKLRNLRDYPANFIAEAARLASPVQFASVETIDQNLSIGQNKLNLPANTPVLLPIGLYNRDPRVFGGAEQSSTEACSFDGMRNNVNSIVTFNAKEFDIHQSLNDSSAQKRILRVCPARDLALCAVAYVIERLKPNVDFDLSTGLKNPWSKLDLGTTLTVKSLIGLHEMTTKTRQRMWDSLSPPCAPPAPLDSTQMVYGKPVPMMNEEDSGDTNFARMAEPLQDFVKLGRILSESMVTGMPVNDLNEQFESVEEGDAFINQIGLAATFPKANYDYKELTSDYAMKQACFAGLFASHAQRVDPTDPNQQAEDRFLPQDCEYVFDFRALSRFEVRAGYERYGAKAYFDASCRLIGVFVSYLNKYFQSPNLDKTTEERFENEAKNAEDNDALAAKRRAAAAKEDPQWQHAKWVFRVTANAWVTLVDHLMYVHLYEATGSVYAARENLPVDHPLRRMMQPFIFGVISVNDQAVTGLIPENGLVHKIWAFTYRGLTEALQFACKSYTYRTGPQWFSPEVLEGVGPQNYPLAVDCQKFYSVFEEYVNDYFAVYYQSDRQIEKDEYLQKYFNSIANFLGIMDVFSAAKLKEIITTLIVSGTGIHEWVGGGVQYLAHIDYCGTRIRMGESWASIQAHTQVLMLVLTTGLRQPMLMEVDLLSVQKESEKGKLKGLTNALRKKLIDLGNEIDADNADRLVPVRCFHPAVQETAVSV